MAMTRRRNPRGGRSPGGMPHTQIGQQGAGTGRVRPQASQQQQQPAQWGAGNAYDAGSTMDKIARNEYLNTLPTGGQRETAMNQMGYWNQGTPYTPQRVNPNQGWMNESMENLGAGSQYQLMGNGGYNGIITGGQGQESQYQSLAQRPMPGGPGQGGGRVRPNRPGGLQGGVHPGMQGGALAPQRPRPGQGGGGQGGGGQAQRGMPEIGGFPRFGQNPPPDFLPNTPGWEAARAQASGNLLNAETEYNTGNQLVGSTLGLQNARLDTDRALAARSVDENMAGRGLVTSGLRAQAQQEQVATPFGRQYQDLALGAAGQYADLASQFGGANLGYNQGLFNSLYQRANDAYEAQPLGMAVGQYQAPDMPGFTPTYSPSGGRRQTRPKKRRKKAGGRK